MRANPEMIKLFSERDRCWMCRHKFDKPIILPVDKPERGKYQPNYNIEVLYHMQDTHGIPYESVPKMIFNCIYGIDNTLQSIYGEKP